MSNAMKETLVREATGRRRHRLRALFVGNDKGNTPKQAVRTVFCLGARAARCTR